MMKHLDSRNFFETDEQFANFRPLILADRKSTRIFRSASAFNDMYGRAETVRKIMSKRHIQSVLDLTVLRCSYLSDKFNYELVELIKRKLVESDQPCIIQCDAGKKRTGFACIVLESLSGSDYKNVVADYLESYKNNNGIDLSNNTVLIQRIIHRQIEPKLRFIAGDNKSSDTVNNLKEDACNYFLRFGMGYKDIERLQEALLK